MFSIFRCPVLDLTFLLLCIGISAIDYRERIDYEMTRYVSSGT